MWLNEQNHGRKGRTCQSKRIIRGRPASTQKEFKRKRKLNRKNQKNSQWRSFQKGRSWRIVSKSIKVRTVQKVIYDQTTECQIKWSSDWAQIIF